MVSQKLFVLGPDLLRRFWKDDLIQPKKASQDESTFRCAVLKQFLDADWPMP